MDKGIKDILREFNTNGYGNPDIKYTDNGKGGKSLVQSIGEYMYEDEVYGGEPYCGNETIWLKEKPIYRVIYYGRFIDSVDHNQIYPFLKKALMIGPDGELIHRGPKEYTQGNLKYTNEIIGDVNEFRQIERIFLNDKEIYVAYVNGGVINIR